jgi:hypothetical protein
MQVLTACGAYLFVFREPIFNPLNRKILWDWPTTGLSTFIGNGLADFFFNRTGFSYRFCFVKQMLLFFNTALTGSSELLMPRQVKLFLEPANLLFKLFNLG